MNDHSIFTAKLNKAWAAFSSPNPVLRRTRQCLCANEFAAWQTEEKQLMPCLGLPSPLQVEGQHTAFSCPACGAVLFLWALTRNYNKSTFHRLFARPRSSGQPGPPVPPVYPHCCSAGGFWLCFVHTAVCCPKKATGKADQSRIVWGRLGWGNIAKPKGIFHHFSFQRQRQQQ